MQSYIVYRRARALVLPVLLPVLALAACNRTREARGEVSAAWSNKALVEVKGVQVAQVRAAIGQRLTETRPKALSEDTWAHVHKLYAQFGNGPLFLSKNGVNDDRVKALLRALASADKDALRLDAYRLPDVARAVTTIEQAKAPTADELAEADVLLSSAYAALGEDLLIGQVNPRNLTQDWHIDNRDEAVDSALVRSLRDPVLDQAIARMRPQDEGYAQLQKDLVRFRDIAKKGGWPKVPAGRSLKPGEGDSPARLAALRDRLAAEGIAVPAAPPVAAPAAPEPGAPASRNASGDAVYDRGLAGAVAQYQSRHGIPVDSILGAGTVESMNIPASYRLGQIAANLERYRWLPRQLGARYVLVNVPAFHLEAYDSGQKVLEMKTIVGQEYEDKNTPVFADSMQYVVFRPYWNVTPDIQKKELEPKIQADPDYMARNDYEYWNDHGVQRVRQKPGDKNSLGYVKFLFPNDFNIYLHDTPQRELFDKDVRAFSHGCIRVEKPAQLAQWALGWDAGKVDQAMHEGKDNVTVTLQQKIPVYIVYFTAYHVGDQLAFGSDLYHRDDQLVKAMEGATGQTPEAIAAVQAISKFAD